MMRFNLKRIYAAVAIVGITVMALAAVSYAVGARINTTASVPVGLYWRSDAPATKGAYVIFCPPDKKVFAMARKRGYITGGFCSGDYSYMMKRILAAKGDTVVINHDGVFVNGALLPHSKPKKVDLGGRKLPDYQAKYKLGSEQLLLMTDVNDISFDARYFGLVNRSQIKTVVYPVITW